MKKQNPAPRTAKKNFTDQIEEWMVGQPADKDAAKSKATRIRKGKAADLQENHSDR